MWPKSIERLNWTVHKRRQVEAIRGAKRRDDHSDLLMRLKVIFDLRMPESWREALSADLPSLTARADPWEGQWMPFRAVDWVISTFWRQLAIEKNPKVRCSLLRLGVRLITRKPFSYSDRTRDAVATNITVDLLEQKDLTAEERERALSLLQEILFWNEADECGDRVVRLGVRMIEEQYTKSSYSSREMRRLADCMRSGVMEWYPSPWVALIIDDDHALSYIFDGIRHAEGRLKRSLSSLLSIILKYAPALDRVTIVTRHFTQLREAFLCINPREFHFMMHSEFAGIVATTPDLINLVYNLQKHDCNGCHFFGPRDAYCQMAVYAMESVLNNDEYLQNLLGLGFLNVAKHFALNRFDFNTRRVETFRQILTKHPQWKRMFREMTERGIEGNMTADFGRTLTDKSSKGSWYILEDEESEL